MLDRGAKVIRWTPHAVENLTDRDIPQEEIDRTIAEPEAISPGKTPDRSVFMRRYHDPTLGKRMLLLVVIEETATERVIVTVITTSRPQRYLRGQP